MKLVDVVQLKKIALIFLCSWLISCGNDKTVSIPENVLSKEKMVLVMMDMHLLEASMNLNLSNTVTTGQTQDPESKIRSVLKKNGVTKEQYETSFAFYTAHTELLSELYTEVLNGLSKLQAKVSNEKVPDQSTSPNASVETMIPVKDKEQPKKNSIERPAQRHSQDSIRRQADRRGHLKLPLKKKTN